MPRFYYMASNGMPDDLPAVVARAGVFVGVSGERQFQKSKVPRWTNMDDHKAPEFKVTIPRAPDNAETADGEWPVTVQFSDVEGFTNLLKPTPPAPPPKLPDAESILTPAQVAEHLQIPMKTVIFLCAEGRLVGAFKAGRRWRIPGRAVRLMATQGQ